MSVKKMLKKEWCLVLVCLKRVEENCSFFKRNVVTSVWDTWKQENPWKPWANYQGFGKAGCSWGKMASK